MKTLLNDIKELENIIKEKKELYKKLLIGTKVRVLHGKYRGRLAEITNIIIDTSHINGIRICARIDVIKKRKHAAGNTKFLEVCYNHGCSFYEDIRTIKEIENVNI